MRIKQITIKLTRSKEIDGYNMLDIVVETSIGVKERHELIGNNDFKSRYEEMLEKIKEEIEELEWELQEKL